MFKEKIIPAIAIVALVISVVIAIKLYVPSRSPLAGATTSMAIEQYVPVVQYNGGIYTNLPFRLGSSGNDQNKFISGTCNLLGMDASILATTSASFDCAVTGVISGDRVLASLSTTTNSVSPIIGWVIQATKASTTAGYITVRVLNLTGGNAVPSATAVGSSTQYWVTN